MKTCQDITGLYEQAKMNRISLSEKLAIGTHRTICKDCRSYFKESDMLDKLLSRKFKDLRSYKFSNEEKSRLKERLKSN